jgi:pyruvate dehydrogenase E1 component alpha subunit
MYDPDRYRDKSEIAEWQKRDPIDALVAEMSRAGELDEAGLVELESDVAGELEAAILAAEQAPTEPVEDLTRFVYRDPTGYGRTP